MTTKLTDQEKVDIVKKYETGKFTITALAKLYGVTRQGLSQLLKRRGFK